MIQHLPQATTVSSNLASIFDYGVQAIPKNFEKSCLFAQLFVRRFVSVNCSTVSIDTKLGSHCQQSPTICLQQPDGGSKAYLMFRPGIGTTSEKSVCFLSLFSQIGNEGHSMVLRASKMEPTRCPTRCSTRNSP